MATWKRIRTEDLVWNKSDLDFRKMFRAGAVKEGATYIALEIEETEHEVKVLANLERGFEEYIWFEKEKYKEFPIALVRSA